MKIQQINFTYPDGTNIFEGLTLDFKDDKVNVLVGPNGSGKTTLLDLIANVDGIRDKRSGFIDFPKATQIAYQLQKSPFWRTASVKQVLMLFDGMTTNVINGITVPSSIKKIMHRRYGELSGGQQQLLMTYCTCQLERELYLFDEPDAGLDETTRTMVLQMLINLNTVEHKKVILITHQLSLLTDEFNIVEI